MESVIDLPWNRRPVWLSGYRHFSTCYHILNHQNLRKRFHENRLDKTNPIPKVLCTLPPAKC